MNSKYKNIIIILIILILGFVAYTVFIKPDPESESFLEVTNREQTTNILGQEILRAINEIQSLRLDRTIFDDPVLRSLIDQSQPIQDLPVGRGNPFAPVGSIPLVNVSGDIDIEVLQPNIN